MILSRNKPARGPAAAGQTAKEKEKKDLPKLEDFLQARDYSGAMTLIEFERHTGKRSDDNDAWMAYSAFHLGDYKRAMEEYEKITKAGGCHPDMWTYLGCCYFMLGMYQEAEKVAQKADDMYKKMPKDGKT